MQPLLARRLGRLLLLLHRRQELRVLVRLGLNGLRAERRGADHLVGPGAAAARDALAGQDAGGVALPRAAWRLEPGQVLLVDFRGGDVGLGAEVHVLLDGEVVDAHAHLGGDQADAARLPLRQLVVHRLRRRVVGRSRRRLGGPDGGKCGAYGSVVRRHEVAVLEGPGPGVGVAGHVARVHRRHLARVAPLGRHGPAAAAHQV